MIESEKREMQFSIVAIPAHTLSMLYFLDFLFFICDCLNINIKRIKFVFIINYISLN